MSFYDGFAGEFDSKMNMYDTNKRLRLVFGELLTEDLSGKKLLDAGCGTGWFSREAAKRGAVVTSLDVGENILAQAAKKCETKRVIGDIQHTDFPDKEFDLIIATEVIEHTADPHSAVMEMGRILKPGGVMVLTTPNRIWHFAVVLANLFKLRPYEGYENWTGWFRLKKWLKEAGLEITVMRGFHAVPFIFPWTYGLIDSADRLGSRLGFLMVNIAVRATKK